MAAPRIIVRQPTFQVALWNNVVISNIEGHVDADGVRQLIETYHTAYASNPDGIAGVTMLRASLKVGDSDTNAEAKRAMHSLRHKILHAAIVIEDKGMLASLLRPIIRTLNSVSRNSVLSIAQDVEQAVRTVAPHVKAPGGGKQPLDAQLLQAVLAVRDGTAK